MKVRLRVSIELKSNFCIQFISLSLNVRIPVTDDDADVVVPWEKMRLLVHMEDAATGSTTVREEPLSYAKLDMLCHPKGHPAFTLHFVRGFWEVSTATHHMHLLDEQSHRSIHQRTLAKRLDEEHRSFSLHFKCGEELFFFPLRLFSMDPSLLYMMGFS